MIKKAGTSVEYLQRFGSSRNVDAIACNYIAICDIDVLCQRPKKFEDAHFALSQDEELQKLWFFEKNRYNIFRIFM